MINLVNLSKIYSNGKGVFDLNFRVGKGEVFGFLGPNGAGKTTTIRCLLGFTNPTSGTCSIGGLDCRSDAAKIQQRLGYMPGEMAFFENMTGLQFMEFIAELRGNRNTKLRDRLIEQFDLEAGRRIRRMSKGMKQKLGLVSAFMHDPEVLILDEPTSGLDPLMQKRFVELILEEKDRGKTILMSSHIFEEIERTCDRAAIIREGKIAAIENIVDLKTSQRKSYLITVAERSDIEKIQASGLECTILDDTTVEIVVSGNYDKMFETLAGCSVTGLDSSAQTLEEIFIRYYGEEVKPHVMDAV